MRPVQRPHRGEAEVVVDVGRIGPVAGQGTRPAVSRHGQHDQPGVERLEFVRRTTPPVERAGPQVLDDHVGLGHEILGDLYPTEPPHVDADAPAYFGQGRRRERRSRSQRAPERAGARVTGTPGALLGVSAIRS